MNATGYVAKSASFLFVCFLSEDIWKDVDQICKVNL